jgi:hypothetical protein
MDTHNLRLYVSIATLAFMSQRCNKIVDRYLTQLRVFLRYAMSFCVKYPRKTGFLVSFKAKNAHNSSNNNSYAMSCITVFLTVFLRDYPAPPSQAARQTAGLFLWPDGAF